MAGGEQVSCGFSMGVLERLGKRSTFHGHIIEMDSTQLCHHDDSTFCLDEEPIRGPHGPPEKHTTNCTLSQGTPVHWSQRNKPQAVAFGTAGPDSHSFCVPFPGILTIWGCAGLGKELANI